MDAILIKGGRILDAATGRDEVGDVLIENSRIARLGGNIEPQDRVKVIDARGMWVIPGLIDLHVHFRDPGYEYKEDLLSGCKAAVAGGFTTVCCKANTNPVNDTGAVTRYIREKAESIGLCRVLPIGAVSKGLKGEALAEIGDMVEEGAVAVSDDGEPVLDSELMRRALEYTRFFGIPVADHPQDKSLSRDGVVHEGRYSVITGLKGMPSCAEDVMVARDVLIARGVGGRLHLDHISTEGAVKLVEWAKSEGVDVTCEVTPHHLLLTDEVITTYDTDTKVNPPLRGEEHVRAVRDALKNGVIDVIATDHAPHARTDKDVEYTRAAFGISGLETALALVMKLVYEGELPLMRVIEAMTVAPAKAYNIDGGRLCEGERADVAVFDPNYEWVVNPGEFFSKGKNTPFKGWQLKGRVRYTIFNGKLVYEKGVVVL